MIRGTTGDAAKAAEAGRVATFLGYDLRRAVRAAPRGMAYLIFRDPLLSSLLIPVIPAIVPVNHQPSRSLVRTVESRLPSPWSAV